jgi:transcriptional regulator with XRE-family HTH domain
MEYMSKQYRDAVLLKHLGNQIRKYRNKLNISQEELAFRCDMSRSYITDIECGIRNIAFSNIVRMCKELKVSIAEFFKDFK